MPRRAALLFLVGAVHMAAIAEDETCFMSAFLAPTAAEQGFHRGGDAVGMSASRDSDQGELHVITAVPAASDPPAAESTDPNVLGQSHGQSRQSQVRASVQALAEAKPAEARSAVTPPTEDLAGAIADAGGENVSATGEGCGEHGAGGAPVCKGLGDPCWIDADCCHKRCSNKGVCK